MQLALAALAALAGLLLRARDLLVLVVLLARDLMGLVLVLLLGWFGCWCCSLAFSGGGGGG